jgi:hypothetical protein
VRLTLGADHLDVPQRLWRRLLGIAGADELPLPTSQFTTPTSLHNDPVRIRQATCPPGQLLEEFRLLYQTTVDPLLGALLGPLISLVERWFDVVDDLTLHLVDPTDPAPGG